MCSRCGETLEVARLDNIRQNGLALGLTGLVLLVLANAFPVMTFSVESFVSISWRKPEPASLE